MNPFRWLKTLVLVIGVFIVVKGAAQAQAGSVALVMEIDGPVTPIMLSFIERGVDTAENRNAEALIIQLNTPGGDVQLTKRIIQALVTADVPVVVYVYPPGGFAASAGTFITLAGHVAAMAPNTSIGAASPINFDGSDINETAQAKVENILVADIEGLAERRGEAAVDWARKTITEAKAAGAEEALELGVIDFIASDLDDLLKQLDGFQVKIDDRIVTLQTAGAVPESLPMTIGEQFLSVILRPEIAFLLLSIGPLAILYELSQPGGYISGVIGVIALLLGLYAVGQLPVNFAGLGLVLLAFILFGAEFFAPTHGALTLSGIISFVLGSLILFNDEELGYQVPIWPLIGAATTIGGLVFFAMSKALATQRRQPTTGVEALLGAKATARTALKPKGTVWVAGERWQAVLDEGEVEAGVELEITGADGFTLHVRKLGDS
ncbi:MAG: nodulation protein NfeD [Anaerolineae bacterium]